MMPTDDTRDLRLKLENLERSCRRWKRLGVGMVAGVGVLVLAGASQSRYPTIEAKEFVLRDPSGLMRAALAIRPDGTPGLGLFDHQNRVRLSLDLHPDDSPSVSLHDAAGAARGTIALRLDGTPGLALADELGRLRVSLEVGADGTSGVNVFDPSGTLRAAVAIRPDGTPGVGLFDSQGQPRQALELELENAPQAIVGAMQ